MPLRSGLTLLALLAGLSAASAQDAPSAAPTGSPDPSSYTYAPTFDPDAGAAEPAPVEAAPVDAVPVEPAPDAPAPDAAADAVTGNMHGVWLEPKLGFALSDPHGTGSGETGLGGYFGLGVGWGWLPLSLGLDVMETFGNTDSSVVRVRSGNQVLPLQQTQQNHITMFNTWLRVEPKIWRFRPYVEGFVGGQWYATDYAVSFGNGDVSTTTSHHDRTYSVGWGAGLELIGLLWKNDAGFGLTFGYRRISGGNASIGHTLSNGDRDVVVHYPVATDMNVYMLGLHARIGR